MPTITDWLSVIISGLVALGGFIVFLKKRKENKENRKKYLLQEAFTYIENARGVTSKQISQYLNISIDETIELLNEMNELKLIANYYLYENKRDANCHWKVLKK